MKVFNKENTLELLNEELERLQDEANKQHKEYNTYTKEFNIIKRNVEYADLKLAVACLEVERVKKLIDNVNNMVVE